MAEDAPTKYLSLTTTFTPPADCWETPKVSYDGTNTQWFIAPGAFTPTCFPPAFPFSETSLIYSPGICPVGWTSACDFSVSKDSSTLNVVNCCPESMGCGPGIDTWEASMACASEYGVDQAAWSLASTAPYVSSMYQRRIMIVEAQTTSSSSSSSPTPDSTTTRSTSTPSETASSTSIETITPTATHGSTPDPGLSKGTIAGIAIGSVVGAAVIATLAYLVWFVKRRQTKQASAAVYAEPPEFVDNKGRS